MKILQAIVAIAMTISTLLIMFIMTATISGWVAPEFAFTLIPYIGGMLISGWAFDY